MSPYTCFCINTYRRPHIQFPHTISLKASVSTCLCFSSSPSTAAHGRPALLFRWVCVAILSGSLWFPPASALAALPLSHKSPESSHAGTFELLVCAPVAYIP